MWNAQTFVDFYMYRLHWMLYITIYIKTCSFRKSLCKIYTNTWLYSSDSNIKTYPLPKFIWANFLSMQVSSKKLVQTLQKSSSKTRTTTSFCRYAVPLMLHFNHSLSKWNRTSICALHTYCNLDPSCSALLVERHSNL